MGVEELGVVPHKEVFAAFAHVKLVVGKGVVLRVEDGGGGVFGGAELGVGKPSAEDDGACFDFGYKGAKIGGIEFEHGLSDGGRIADVCHSHGAFDVGFGGDHVDQHHAKHGRVLAAGGHLIPLGGGLGSNVFDGSGRIHGRGEEGKAVNDEERARQVRMFDGKLEGDEAAEAVSDDGGRVEVVFANVGGEVVGDGLEEISRMVRGGLFSESV